MEQFDIIVVGAGHAGVEAAVAAARLGKKTAVFTLSADMVANMPCNPSIGGTAKGHLVREIDALGGQMAKAADRTMLQSRMLNRGKGPAVHSLRVQSDRAAYHAVMKKLLETTENLYLKQGEIVQITADGQGVTGVLTKLGGFYAAKAVILCTGTFLGGMIHVGETSYSSGPDGMHAANALTDSLKALGLPLRRFKTGTPARVNRRSIDFSVLERQEGETPVEAMSFATTKVLRNRVACYIAYTNETTHQIIRDNLHRSPLYSGRIEGIGPRYCPSIEDKVVRFSDKSRHQIFLEPCGLSTDEWYVQGMSSSLPEEVQVAMYRSIKGFENIEFIRPAYAIEYECIDPLALRPTLETKAVSGLYGAGQFCGTSGYEEAAAQGLIAGINAARKLSGESRFVLSRSESYIGTLIDDLTTKGVIDPYRMMTSRSEFRLLLRQDNAQTRLTEKGYAVGLVTKAEYRQFQAREEQRKSEIARLCAQGIAPSAELNEMLESRGTAPLSVGTKLSELLKRPQISYGDLAPFDKNRPALPPLVIEQAETEIKYEGYIRRQESQVKELARLENKALPEGIDYQAITGLRLEAREKLSKISPESIGQASRISGVSPADISVLLIYLEKWEGEKRLGQ